MKRSSRKFTVRTSDEDGRLLASRLIGCLPAATVEMETLCRMAGIKVSTAVPTAAVECVNHPRLLINPDFAAKYCARDEHLFLLVMHELWHIILAHTRLYPRVTTAHNIAFDAIINAGLSRLYLYDRPEYRGFFEELNPPDKFPHLLLRPPVGWPSRPEYPEGVGPAGTRQILERLYPPPSARQSPIPFYDEILQLLRQYAEDNGWVWVEGEPLLLGDHDDPELERKVMSDTTFRGMMQRIAKSAQLPLGSRGRGGLEENYQSEFGPSTERARRAFSNVLRRCLGPRQGGQRRKTKSPVPGIAGTSVIPNPRDRLAPARSLLGIPNTIWAQPGTVKARVPEKPSKAHVYLDVSGSMAEVLPHLLHLVLPYAVSGQADIFQFSTRIEPLPVAQLKHGRLRTTGGTDIDCVLEHVLDVVPVVRRVLILTDGATGIPADGLVQRTQEKQMRFYVVLPAESPWEEDLREMAAFMTILPPLWGGGPRPRSRW